MEQAALQLINKHWPVTIQPVGEDLPEDEVVEEVRKRIRYLLDHDMERLLHTLYRIDVPEGKTRHALATADPDLIDIILTELILERIREKIETRKKYSGN